MSQRGNREREQLKDGPWLLQRIMELSDAPGIAGEEEAVRGKIIEALRGTPCQLSTDSMGNLFAAQEGDGPTVMLAAHMDEVGLMVTHADDDGLLRFRTVGGFDARVLAGRRVQVGRERLAGVIGTLPIHLTDLPDRSKAHRLKDLYIDIGAKDGDEARRLVKPGTMATFSSRCMRVGEHRLMGKALDDRVGCAIGACLARRRWPHPLVAAFTVQEEIGLRGAGVAAYRVKPDAAIVLETTTAADVPEVDGHKQVTRLGKGPAISFKDRTSIGHPGLVRTLISIAESRGIPYQWREGTTGGNDAGSIHTAGAGIPTATISVPARYLHSAASIVDLRDVEDAVRWVEAFLEEAQEGSWLEE